MIDENSEASVARDAVPVLLFDVMSTLVYDPFHEAVPAHLGLSFDELIAQKHPTTWVEFELGEIDERTALSRFFRDRRPIDRDRFVAMLRRTYAWLPGVEPLLGALRSAGVSMHVLSNYPIWYRIIEQELQLSRYLPWTFVSCETGVRKPASEAFLGPARELGRPPAELLLVDDQPRNCEAARRVGLGAIRFRDAAALRHELEQRGLL